MYIVLIIGIIIICCAIGYFGDKRLRSKKPKDEKEISTKKSVSNEKIVNNTTQISNNVDQYSQSKLDELNEDYTVAPVFDFPADSNANNNQNQFGQYNAMSNPGMTYQNEIPNNMANSSLNQNQFMNQNSYTNQNMNMNQNSYINQNMNMNQNVVQQPIMPQPMLGQNANFYGSNMGNPINANNVNTNNSVNPIAEDGINNMF